MKILHPPKHPISYGYDVQKGKKYYYLSFCEKNYRLDCSANRTVRDHISVTPAAAL